MTSSMSNLTATLPRVSAQTIGQYTIAHRTLSTIKSVFAGRVRELPVRGESKTAKFRKVDPTDCLSMDVHELASVLSAVTSTDAISILSSLAEDGGQGDAVCVKSFNVPRASSLLEAEADMSVSFGALVCAIDQVRQHKTSIDQRQLHELIVGTEARMRSAMLACGAM